MESGENQGKQGHANPRRTINQRFTNLWRRVIYEHDRLHKIIIGLFADD